MNSSSLDASTATEMAACTYISNYSCPHDFIKNYGYTTYMRCLEFQTHWMTYSEYEMKERAVFILYGCILSFLSILGILGNALSFWIMLTPEFCRSTTTIYLRVLMIMDSLYLMANFFHYSLLTGLQLSRWLIDALPSYSRVYVNYITMDLLRNGSALLILGVTVERYIHVCHALTATTKCTLATSKLTVAVMIAVVVVYEIPRFLVLQVTESYVDGAGNSSYCLAVYLVKPSGLMQESAETALNISGTVIFYLIPMLAIIVVTWRLLAAIKKSSSFRQRTTTRRHVAQEKARQDSNDRNTTIILLSVVITFILCNLPNTFIVIARLIGVWDKWNLTLTGSLTFYIATLLLNLNSAGNVMFFCFFGQKFRNIFVQIIFRCHCKRRQRQAYNRTVKQSAGYSSGPTTSLTEIPLRKPLISKASALSLRTFRTSESSCSEYPELKYPETKYLHP